MQLSSPVGNQFIKRTKAIVDYLALFETIDDRRTDVSTAADSGRVSQELCCLLDRLDNFPLSRGLPLDDVFVQPRQGARTNERSGPGTEVFGAEVLPHHSADILVDVMASDVYKIIIAVLILEDLA